LELLGLKSTEDATVGIKDPWKFTNIVDNIASLALGSII